MPSPWTPPEPTENLPNFNPLFSSIGNQGFEPQNQQEFGQLTQPNLPNNGVNNFPNFWNTAQSIAPQNFQYGQNGNFPNSGGSGGIPGSSVNRPFNNQNGQFGQNTNSQNPFSNPSQNSGNNGFPFQSNQGGNFGPMQGQNGQFGQGQFGQGQFGPAQFGQGQTFPGQFNQGQPSYQGYPGQFGQTPMSPIGQGFPSQNYPGQGPFYPGQNFPPFNGRFPSNSTINRPTFNPFNSRYPGQQPAFNPFNNTNSFLGQSNPSFNPYNPSNQNYNPFTQNSFGQNPFNQFQGQNGFANRNPTGNSFNNNQFPTNSYNGQFPGQNPFNQNPFNQNGQYPGSNNPFNQNQFPNRQGQNQFGSRSPLREQDFSNNLGQNSPFSGLSSPLQAFPINPFLADQGPQNLFLNNFGGPMFPPNYNPYHPYGGIPESLRNSSFNPLKTGHLPEVELLNRPPFLFNPFGKIDNPSQFAAKVHPNDNDIHKHDEKKENKEKDQRKMRGFQNFSPQQNLLQDSRGQVPWTNAGGGLYPSFPGDFGQRQQLDIFGRPLFAGNYPHLQVPAPSQGSTTSLPNKVNDLRDLVPGTPEVDYPVYGQVPETSFSCDGKTPGYYADVETRCQVFHICIPDSDGKNMKQSFLCGNGTLFNEPLNVCQWWSDVSCQRFSGGKTSTGYNFPNEQKGESKDENRKQKFESTERPATSEPGFTSKFERPKQLFRPPYARPPLQVPQSS